jgi:hypothetical protein
MSEKRHKLTQRRGVAKKAPTRPKRHVHDRQWEGLRNKEVCELLEISSAHVASAAKQGKLDRHDDGSYTQESVLRYARRNQGKIGFEINPKPEAITGELVTTNGRANSGTLPLEMLDLEALEMAILRLRIQDLEMQVGLRRVAYQRESGAVLDRQSMEQTVQAAFARMRDGLLNLPGRLTPELTGLSEEREVYRRIDREVRDMIRELQRAIDNL